MEKTKKITILALTILPLLAFAIYFANAFLKTTNKSTLSVQPVVVENNNGKIANDVDNDNKTPQTKASTQDSGIGGEEKEVYAEEDIVDIKNTILEINTRIKEDENQLSAVKKTGKDISGLNKELEEAKKMVSKAQAEIAGEKFSNALSSLDQADDILNGLEDSIDEALGDETESADSEE